MFELSTEHESFVVACDHVGQLQRSVHASIACEWESHLS